MAQMRGRQSDRAVRERRRRRDRSCCGTRSRPFSASSDASDTRWPQRARRCRSPSRSRAACRKAATAAPPSESRADSRAMRRPHTRDGVGTATHSDCSTYRCQGHRAGQQSVVNHHVQPEHPDDAVHDSRNCQRRTPSHRSKQSERQRHADQRSERRTRDEPERGGIQVRCPTLSRDEVRIDAAEQQ